MENTIKSVNEKENRPRFQESPEDAFVTIKRSEVKQFLEGLSESLAEIDSFKEYVSKNLNMKLRDIENFENTTISLFNSLVETASELKEKIAAAGNYEDYLEERIKNANLSKEISLLELHLNKEKAEITIILNEISETVKKSVASIETKTSELKSANNVIEESILKFSVKTNDSFDEFSQKAEKELEEIGNHIMAVSENQQTALKIQCEQMIRDYTEKCRDHLEIVKKQSLEFLRQCEEENKKLIGKVPYITDKKLSKKDFIIYALSVLTFLEIIIRFFCG